MAAIGEDGASVGVEMRGITLYTHHGVTEAERELGQRLELDVTLELADCEALETDELEGTIDYSAAYDIVAAAATERSYRTLERLAQVIGERLVERLGARVAHVRARKPDPPIEGTVGSAGVEVAVERPR